MPLRSANIVGSGPNGLAAAITLAQQGVAVTVWERGEQVGGACSTAAITLPGFQHDLGSSAYPLGVASPFFRTLPLREHGLRWIEPPLPLAHPLEGGDAVALHHSLAETAAQFTAHDARAWHCLFAPQVRDWPALVADFTRPLLRVPSHPVAMATFGSAAIWPAQLLANTVFRGAPARALLAGNAAHSVLPLTRLGSAATGLVLATAAHTTGWPVSAGGGGAITQALASYLLKLGGRLVTGYEVRSLPELQAHAPADVTLFDTGAGALDRLAGEALSPSFRARLRHFRRGPGIFKLDWALREPIPWRAEACRRAGTVHLGGSLGEIARSEAEAFAGHLPRPDADHPFVLLVQPSLFDPARAPLSPGGRPQHTAWAYCHVPAGSDADRTAAIEAQVERFAPGFRDVILARCAWNSSALFKWNPNLAGGDVSGGAMTLSQLLARPTLRTYRTSNPRIYLCSSSTPPGGGVHGMCGHNAALAVLQDHGTP